MSNVFENCVNSKHNLECSGVYVVYNIQNQVIYVGKAKNLKKRLLSYTRGDVSTKTFAMIYAADRIELQYTKNETEALILESELIKKYKPRYNILLKDDKEMTFIKISANHSYPAIGSVRLRKNLKVDKTSYFGPFTSSDLMRKMLNLTRKTFQLRDCSDIMFSNRTRPCIQYDIKECTAPCVNFVSKEDYSTQVKDAKSFLSGDYEKTIKTYERAMQIASKNMNFELAASMRDKIQMLKDFASVPQDVHYINCDIIAYASNESNTRFIFGVVVIRKKIEINRFFQHLDAPEGVEIEEVVANFLENYYLTNEMPTSILLDLEALQKRKLFDYLDYC
ncbi:MAG: hypothetical protein RL208_642 [Pseudomonadota bacterium]|jgi:excinuclease ABC subunit C